MNGLDHINVSDQYNDTDAITHENNNLEHRPGITNAEVIEYYSGWVKTFEKDQLAEGYRGFKIAADFCDILIPNKNSKILDVGAGTGFAGEYLTHHGFNNMDALEPTEGLLEIARKKSIYNQLICEGIVADKQTSIADDTYDAIIAPGVFIEGHIPSAGLKELARITKSGGLVIIVMREEYLSTVKDFKDGLEPLMNEMENNGTWKKLLRLNIPKYSFIKDGVAYIFKIN